MRTHRSRVVGNDTQLRYYAEYSQALDINHFESIDNIVEAAVESGNDVIVDLAAQAGHPLDHWINDSGLLELKDEVDLNTTLWHIMDDGSDSVRLLGNLLETYGDGPTYFVARNLGRGADFSLFDESDEKKQAEQLGATNINIPNLHSGTMRKIDRTGASLWAAANNRDAAVGPTLNLLERQRAKIWLNKAYSELRWAMRPPRKQRDNA